MKNKLLALFASLGMSGFAFGDIQIGENVTIKGFIDASYQNTNSDAANDSTDVSLDEVEIDFLFNVGNVTGEVHLDNGDTPNGDSGFDIEQAHFTYTHDSGVSFTLGNYGSSLGFEREDPAGLYTYSRAYGDISRTADANGDIAARASTFNLGDVDSNDVHGITISYAAETFSIAASLENPATNADGVGNADRKDLETNNADLEVSITYTGIDNVNIGVGYFFDNEAVNTNEEDVLNFHASTTLGKLFIAGEYTEIQTENVAFGDLDANMLLLDYDFNDKLGAALRISSNETNTNNEDYDKITIAPNYAITDSLGAIIEYSDIDQGTIDVNEFAVELTYTF